MRVSVVLPVYNGERFLPKSIDSIIQQTMTDWELLIVDDASTDDSLLIAKEYEKKDSRIRVIKNPENFGLPRSLNVGFEYAEGMYLTWTSDDNMFLKYAFEELSCCLDENTHCDMVCSAMLVIDENDRIIGLHQEYCENEMYLFDTVGASFMYRRDILNTVGTYDESLFCVEDYDYWVRILKAGGKIEYIKGCHYLYRTHKNSLTVEKEQLVRSNQRKLYAKHFEWICSGLDTVQKVVFLYNELNIAHYYEECQLLKRKFGLFCDERRLDDKKKIILFGAGKIGKDVLTKIKRVDFFVDSYNYGKHIDGVEVLSFDQMIRVYSKEVYQIVISVSYDKQLDLVNRLKSVGINEYVLYSSVF